MSSVSQKPENSTKTSRKWSKCLWYPKRWWYELDRNTRKIRKTRETCVNWFLVNENHEMALEILPILAVCWHYKITYKQWIFIQTKIVLNFRHFGCDQLTLEVNIYIAKYIWIRLFYWRFGLRGNTLEFFLTSRFRQRLWGSKSWSKLYQTPIQTYLNICIKLFLLFLRWLQNFSCSIFELSRKCWHQIWSLMFLQ